MTDNRRDWVSAVGGDREKSVIRRMGLVLMVCSAIAGAVLADPPSLGKLPDPTAAPIGSSILPNQTPPPSSGNDPTPPSWPSGPAVPPQGVAIHDLDGPTVGPPSAFWGEFQWLLWTTKGQQLPLLVTGGNGGMFGDSRVGNDLRSGFRATGGLWLSDHQTIGLEAEFLVLGQSSSVFDAGPAGTISRPFVNAQTGRADALLISAPGVSLGQVGATFRTNLFGAGVRGLFNLDASPDSRIDILLGYRFMDLNDVLFVNSSSVALVDQPGLTAGSLLQIQDRWKTENTFHGGQIGLTGEQRFSWLTLSARASVALGVDNEATRLEGVGLLTTPTAGAVPLHGGFLAPDPATQPPQRSVFAAMPELDLRAGLQLTSWAKASIGYDVLYLSSVARVSNAVNLTALPPSTTAAASPLIPGTRTSGFWAQGVSLGLELRF